jgi:hypothetical protein
VFFVKFVMGIERRLVAAAVYNKGHAHDRQFVERTWHGRITQGADGQHARAFFTPPAMLRSLVGSAAGGRVNYKPRWAVTARRSSSYT